MKIWKKDYYESLFRKRAQTVQDYQLQILYAQDKIRELQGKCNHLEFEVCFYSWRPGAMHPARICKSCNARISDATEEESKKLWDEFHAKAGLPEGSQSSTSVVFTSEKK